MKGSLNKVPLAVLEKLYRNLPYMLIIFMSSGKQDNIYTKCWYRNVDRPEVLKCSRLASILLVMMQMMCLTLGKNCS